MAGKKQLPPVKIVRDETPEGPATVSNAVTRLEELRAMRRVLAAHIDNKDTQPRDLAAIMRQAREISKEIEDLEGTEPVSEVSVNDDGTTDDAPFRLEAI